MGSNTDRELVMQPGWMVESAHATLDEARAHIVEHAEGLPEDALLRDQVDYLPLMVPVKLGRTVWRIAKWRQ